MLLVFGCFIYNDQDFKNYMNIRFGCFMCGLLKRQREREREKTEWYVLFFFPLLVECQYGETVIE